MSKHDDDHSSGATSELSRRARLQALLFTGAAFSAALLTLAAEPKLPPFKGE